MKHEENTQMAESNSPETLQSISDGVLGGIEPFINFFQEKAFYLTQQIASPAGLYQIVVLGTGILIALLMRKPSRKLLTSIWPNVSSGRPFMYSLKHSVERILVPLVWVLWVWGALHLFRKNAIDHDMMRIVASMLQAWIFVTLFSAVVKNPAWSKLFSVLAWSVAALYILKLLDPTIALLDGIGVNLNENYLSVYDMIKGTILLVLLVWIATLISKLFQARLQRSKSVSPSMQSLVSQLFRIGTLFFAAVIALNAIGLDLRALVIFSGAIGVGIGFGLQAIFSNLMSGVIMLMEGSVSVGDFVELESGVTGEVKEINTRATLITTNDRVDILVPNSQFINGMVTNWTLRDKHRRTRIPFGVAYGSDKDLVKKAALEAAASLPHELKGEHARSAEVWLVRFGESSLDFELVLWLHPDAVKRPMAILAEYNWAIETALRKYNIEIPFPQRDLHIKSGLPFNDPILTTGRI